MKLSPRLKTIANNVLNCKTCCDIGTDHGYIPIYLIKKNIANRAIATDINIGPLRMAKKQIEYLGLENKIQIRLGAGLEPIQANEVDTAIIAGMGGLLIRDIIESSKITAKSISNFVLQPMIAQAELRKYLIDNDFIIVDEDLAQEGKRIYEIIIVKHGTQKIENNIYMDIGKPLIDKKHPLLPSLINLKKNELIKIINLCKGKNSRNAELRIKECNNKLLALKEVEKCL